MLIESRNKRCPDSAAVLHVRLFALHRHAKVGTRNAVPIAEVALSVFETTTPPLSVNVFTVLTKLDPASHWLAGQIAGIHLFTLAGGMAIGAAAVLLYHSIGRIAGVSGIFFTGIKEGGLWRGLFLGGIVVGAGLGAYFFPSLNIVSRRLWRAPMAEGRHSPTGFRRPTPAIHSGSLYI